MNPADTPSSLIFILMVIAAIFTVGMAWFGRLGAALGLGVVALLLYLAWSNMPHVAVTLP